MFMHSARRTKAQILDGAADVESSRFVARNTVEWIDSAGVRRIRLHATDILEFYPNGAIDVHTGGWNTHTTRARLRAFLPRGFAVYTSQGVAYLSHPKGETSFNESVYIGSRGAVKADSPRGIERDRRLIDSYMAKIRKLGTIPFPYGGDPWIPTDPTTGKYAAVAVRSWLDDGYIFGSLSVAAGRWCGLSDLGIRMLMFDGSDATTRRRIRRYLRGCLGYAT